MKVFRMNDCDWWMAETLEQAVNDYLKMTGSQSDLDRGEMLDDPAELTPHEMASHEFYPDETQDPDKVISFSTELKYRIARGATSELFASTEY